MSNPMFCSNSQNENLSAFPTVSRQDSCCSAELNNCVQLQYHRAQIFLLFILQFFMLLPFFQISFYVIIIIKSQISTSSRLCVVQYAVSTALFHSDVICKKNFPFRMKFSFVEFKSCLLALRDFGCCSCCFRCILRNRN